MSNKIFDPCLGCSTCRTKCTFKKVREQLDKAVYVLEKESKVIGCDCDYCLTSVQRLAIYLLKEIRGEK